MEEGLRNLHIRLAVEEEGCCSRTAPPEEGGRCSRSLVVEEARRSRSHHPGEGTVVVNMMAEEGRSRRAAGIRTRLVLGNKTSIDRSQGFSCVCTLFRRCARY